MKNLLSDAQSLSVFRHHSYQPCIYRSLSNLPIAKVSSVIIVEFLSAVRATFTVMVGLDVAWFGYGLGFLAHGSG